VRSSSEVIEEAFLDPTMFKPGSVKPATLELTERLRRDGATAPALSNARVHELRRLPPGAVGVLTAEPPSDLAVDREIEGPAAPARLRALRPDTVRACDLHLHGGGWALGAPYRQEQTLSRFASAARVATVAVDYRLTPENPHPAGLQDCVAAIHWLAANGERELSARRLVVAGESAGVHLAALALLALRDSGEIEAVTAANLAYGVYDVSMTPSARRWGDQRIVINTSDLAFFAAQYASKDQHGDPGVSPLYPTLTDMPIALFTCGTLDPLLDDTFFMTARWQAAGNEARLQIYPGAPHEFLNLSDPIRDLPKARERMLALSTVCSAMEA
jgi:acetyl esterase/lipase